MLGEIEKNTPISTYQPSKEICDITKDVKTDAFFGQRILERPYFELNGRSVITDENHGQIMFNTFVDTDTEDPNEAWKWRGTRSMARNKAINLHANLTSSFLFANYSAQNDDDEIDQNFSEIMRDVVEWMASPTVSNYQSSYMQATLTALYSPVVYLGAEYCEVFQTIRERQMDGTTTKKEILDEVLSGFQAPVLSASQVLITNAFERNIQKQRRIIKRYYAEYKELAAKYEWHENWQFISSNGIRSIFNEENGLFYDVKDKQERRHLVLVEIAESRRNDSEIVFINGVYFGDINDVENNPIKHRDNRGAPKYNVVPFGYSRIGEHFFYYKSMMNVLTWDNMMYDGMSEVLMNRALLEVEFPIAISGTDKFDSDIVFPNSVVSFENPDAKVTKLLPDSNSNFGFEALKATRESMDDAGNTGEMAGGNLPDASQKAYNVAQSVAAGKKLIGAVGKSIGESILMYGDLMKDIAINHITTPQIDLLAGDKMKLKYRSFLVAKKSGAAKKHKKIIFDHELIGVSMTEDEKTRAELKLLEETDYPSTIESLHRINPELFAKFKYLVSVDIEEMFSKNQEYWQPVLLNLKQALINDPYTNQEELTKKLMYSYFQSDGADMIKKQVTPPPQTTPVPGQQGPNQFGNTVNAKQLGAAAGNIV